MPPLDRLVEIRNKFRGNRNGLLKNQQKMFGGGKVIKKTLGKTEKLGQRVQERKPDVIPQINEALSKWQAGRRITDAISTGISGQKSKKIKEKVKTRVKKTVSPARSKTDINIG